MKSAASFLRRINGSKSSFLLASHQKRCFAYDNEMRGAGENLYEQGQEIKERLDRTYVMPKEPPNLDTRIGDVKHFDYKGVSCIEGLHNDYIAVDGVKFTHSILIFPKFTVLWRPRRIKDITPESLLLCSLFHPGIRHIFIGIGSAMKERPHEMPELIEQGVTYEFMTTFSATQSFNMMNSSGGTQDFCCAMMLPLPEDDREEYVFDFIPKRQLDMFRELRGHLDD